MLKHLLVAPLLWAIRSLVRRGILSSSVGDAAAVLGNVRPAEGPAGEDHEAVECVMPPGFTAIPPDGTEAVLICVAGDTGHPIVIPSASARLAGLTQGEAALHDANNVTTGPRVIVRQNGNVQIFPGALGQVQIIPHGSVATPLPVARATDPVILNATDVATLNTIINAWNAEQPAGGNLMVVGGVSLPAITGTGTIAAGGTGTIST